MPTFRTHRRSFRRSLRRSLAVAGALGLSLAFALPAGAYVIYTKDGTRIEAKDKPTVQGKKLLFLTPLGTPQSISTSEWDQERTEKVNKAGIGNAYQLDEPTSDRRAIPNPTNVKPSLSDYIKTHKKNELPPERSEKPSEDGVEKAPTPAETVPLPLDSQINEVFSRALDGSNLRGARLVGIAGGLRVQATTENEQQVFWALAAVARGLKESRAHGRAIEKVDLYLATSSGENAGHFVMSPDEAEALLNGRISPAKYFIANVMF
jgi:hypothetical protein